jgi:hypothetical protein
MNLMHNTLIRGTSATENMSYSKIVKCCFMILNDKRIMFSPCTPTWSSPFSLIFLFMVFLFVLCTYFLFIPCLFHVHLCILRPYGNTRHSAGTILVLSMSLGLSLPSRCLVPGLPTACPCPVPDLPLACLFPVLGLSFPCPWPVLPLSCPLPVPDLFLVYSCPVLGLLLPCPWASFGLSLPCPWASLGMSVACSFPVLSFACP